MEWSQLHTALCLVLAAWGLSTAGEQHRAISRPQKPVRVNLESWQDERVRRRGLFRAAHRHHALQEGHRFGPFGPFQARKERRQDCEDPIDCVFDPWTSWDSSTCEGGRGQKMRSRNVKTQASNGGPTGP